MCDVRASVPIAQEVPPWLFLLTQKVYVSRVRCHEAPEMVRLFRRLGLLYNRALRVAIMQYFCYHKFIRAISSFG